MLRHGFDRMEQAIVREVYAMSKRLAWAVAIKIRKEKDESKEGEA